MPKVITKPIGGTLETSNIRKLACIELFSDYMDEYNKEYGDDEEEELDFKDVGSILIKKAKAELENQKAVSVPTKKEWKKLNSGYVESWDKHSSSSSIFKDNCTEFSPDSMYDGIVSGTTPAKNLIQPAIERFEKNSDKNKGVVETDVITKALNNLIKEKGDVVVTNDNAPFFENLVYYMVDSLSIPASGGSQST